MRNVGRLIVEKLVRVRGRLWMIAMLLVLSAACTPRVEVTATDKPITINLNVKIDQTVRIQLDREVEDLIAQIESEAVRQRNMIERLQLLESRIGDLAAVVAQRQRVFVDRLLDRLRQRGEELHHADRRHPDRSWLRPAAGSRCHCRCPRRK